jgi:hypothetical protein
LIAKPTTQTYAPKPKK